MHSMKNRGGNGHAFFDRDMHNQSYEKIELEHGLHLALSRGELEMYYQPQTDVRTGKVIGAEALMRWNHPQRGFLGAGAFLPFAEESGLIIPISDWMLDATCRDLLAWNALGGPRTVSYTHLDVYKRQVFRIPTARICVASGNIPSAPQWSRATLPRP